MHTEEVQVDDPKSEQGPLVGTVIDGRTCKQKTEFVSTQLRTSRTNYTYQAQNASSLA